MSMRLKSLRKKLRVTLETLVDRTGLTKSYLSKVEHELSAPLITATLKLVEASNVQVEELSFEKSDGVDGYNIARHSRHKSLSSGDDGPIYASLAQQIDACALLSFIVHLPCDFSHLMFKERLGGEFISVHEGQIEVDFMSQRIILERDDALHFNTQKPHRTRSLGETQAGLLVVVHSDEWGDGPGRLGAY